MRFELTTLTLARLCSTPELRPLGGSNMLRGRCMKQADENCNQNLSPFDIMLNSISLILNFEVHFLKIPTAIDL